MPLRRRGWERLWCPPVRTRRHKGTAGPGKVRLFLLWDVIESTFDLTLQAGLGLYAMLFYFDPVTKKVKYTRAKQPSNNKEIKVKRREDLYLACAVFHFSS